MINVNLHYDEEIMYLPDDSKLIQCRKSREEYLLSHFESHDAVYEVPPEQGDSIVLIRLYPQVTKMAVFQEEQE